MADLFQIRTKVNDTCLVFAAFFVLLVIDYIVAIFHATVQVHFVIIYVLGM